MSYLIINNNRYYLSTYYVPETVTCINSCNFTVNLCGKASYHNHFADGKLRHSKIK